MDPFDLLDRIPRPLAIPACVKMGPTCSAMAASIHQTGGSEDGNGGQGRRQKQCCVVNGFVSALLRD